MTGVAGDTEAPAGIRVDPGSFDADLLVTFFVERETGAKPGSTAAQTPSLLFDRDKPYRPCVDPASIRIHATFQNPRVIRGGVAVRLAYDYQTPSLTPEEYARDAAIGIDPDAPNRVMPAFAILIFDPEGELVEAHTDRPL